MRVGLLLPWLLTSAAVAADEVLAVLPFAVHAEDPSLAYLGPGVADMLVTDLQRGEGVRLVERTRIEAVLDELALQASEFVDPETARKIGAGLGATDLVIGSVTMNGDRMRIDARLIDVSTGEARLADQAEGKPDAFFDLERTLALRLLNHLDIELDAPARAYFEGQAPVATAKKRKAAPTDGPRAKLRFSKKLGRTFVLVDGQSIGENRRRAPLGDADVSVGSHELAIGAESGTFVECYGVLEVPPTGLELGKRRDLCAQLDAETDPPYGTVRRGGRIALVGDECGAPSLTVGDQQFAGGCGTLHVEPGLVMLLLENHSWGQDWSCSGYVNVLPGSHETVTINGAGCHGFHRPGVLPTEGPWTWSRRISKEKQAADEAEREARMAD